MATAEYHDSDFGIRVLTDSQRRAVVDVSGGVDNLECDGLASGNIDGPSEGGRGSLTKVLAKGRSAMIRPSRATREAQPRSQRWNGLRDRRQERSRTHIAAAVVWPPGMMDTKYGPAAISPRL
jgi:hypothetical protein